jgi:hypothetical protein
MRINSHNNFAGTVIDPEGNAIIFPATESELEIIGRLVDRSYDKYMRHVWSAIHRRTTDYEHTDKWFFHKSVAAYRWFEYERKTRLEKKQELHAISEKSVELAKLIKQSALANALSYEVVEDCVKCNALLQYESIKEILLKLAEKLEAEAEIAPTAGKPNTDNAHSIVFVRRLTESMREKFGQPLRMVVANTACVFFDTGDINEKFVRDNTRN